MRKYIVLIVFSFFLSSFFGVNLKNKNEEEVKKLISGKWQSNYVKSGYLTIYTEEFLSNDSVIFTLITKNLKSKLEGDTNSVKFHYKIKNDSLIFNLGSTEKPYFEGYKLVYLSKNKMIRQFKKSKSKYKRIN